MLFTVFSVLQFAFTNNLCMCGASRFAHSLNLVNEPGAYIMKSYLKVNLSRISKIWTSVSSM